MVAAIALRSALLVDYIHDHSVFGGLNRTGIPRIIPESIKVGDVKISTIDEETKDLVKV